MLSFGCSSDMLIHARAALTTHTHTHTAVIRLLCHDTIYATIVVRNSVYSEVLSEILGCAVALFISIKSKICRTEGYYIWMRFALFRIFGRSFAVLLTFSVFSTTSKSSARCVMICAFAYLQRNPYPKKKKQCMYTSRLKKGNEQTTDRPKGKESERGEEMGKHEQWKQQKRNALLYFILFCGANKIKRNTARVFGDGQREMKKAGHELLHFKWISY